MIPYIIINGVSSRTIDGLLIQSLPPITKPKIRTSIEEIDGRDGDIAQILGYSAYDKPITIGLKGDYNVDDVIEYFNTKGEVIFSNELDKYYKFAVYDAIDFNKLIRYRTATINLHCQPFKYLADEQPINVTSRNTITNITVRNTGNVYSKPLLTIKGKDTVTVYIDNVEILSCELGNTESTMIIDADAMNAYGPDGVFLNRQVTGDYKNLIFKPKHNILTVTGQVQTVKVERYNRWI